MNCATQGCVEETTGKSKYCRTHAREARERWREMVKSKSTEREDRDAKFYDLWVKAREAGLIAGRNACPTPMTVTQHQNMADDNSPVAKQWYVPEGACGFAWVIVRPGNSPFANWLKKHGHGSKAYEGGVMVWVGYFGQSITRKEACARAMADVFREGGIDAYSNSRLD